MNLNELSVPRLEKNVNSMVRDSSGSWVDVRKSKLDLAPPTPAPKNMQLESSEKPPSHLAQAHIPIQSTQGLKKAQGRKLMQAPGSVHSKKSLGVKHATSTAAPSRNRQKLFMAHKEFASDNEQSKLIVPSKGS